MQNKYRNSPVFIHIERKTIIYMQVLALVVYTWAENLHSVTRGSKGAIPSPKFLESIVILCFEMRFSRQNSVFCPPPIFALATPLIAIAVSTIEGHSYFSTLSFYLFC